MIARDPATVGWVASGCARCGDAGGEVVLAIDDPRGPPGGCAILHCSGCGLRRLDPRPTDERATTYYGDAYNAFVGRARGRVKQRVWDLLRDLSSGRARLTRRWRLGRRLARRLTAQLVDIALAPPHGTSPTILDVGCGYGDLLIYYCSRGCRVRGVEADPRAVKKATEYGIDVALEDPAEIGLPTASVDATILCHSLEHLSDPGAALEEIARLSRPGAELHVAVPNGAAEGLERQGASWGHLSFPLHLWYFDAGSLLGLMEDAGFEPESVTYRMTWGFHRLTWSDAIRARGWRAVVPEIAATVVTVLSRPERRDVLRVTARRRG